MQSTAQKRPVSQVISRAGNVSCPELEDRSPFGLQALLQEELRIIKPDCTGQLAFALALRGTRAQIRDRDFAERILANRPDWSTEYRIVHLIERSLWIHGQSKLVMSMTRNPSQIPDNPPPPVMAALTRSYATHATATTWYGVPLFSEETNAAGLPLPVTAADVRAEHESRINQAQAHALRWRSFYRAAFWGPQVVNRTFRRLTNPLVTSVRRWRNDVQTYRRESQLRKQCRNSAAIEYYRLGRCVTKVPEHTSSIGRVTNSLEEVVSHPAVTQLGDLAREIAEIAQSAMPVPDAVTLAVGGSVPFYIASLVAGAAVPYLPIIACDPFLFVELPEEPNKLRFIGHWYWQQQHGGKQVLHLHV